MSEYTCIAIVGHQPLSTRLPSQYLFIRRSSDIELSPDLDKEYKFKAKSFVWSEYAAWFENSRFFTGKKVTGLFHYRCALNMLPFSFSTFPSSLMSSFLKWQNQQIQKKENFLFVGEPNHTENSVWEQFTDAHPESIHILQAACEIYDTEVGLSKETSEERLKSKNYYYPRNIFLTDTSFCEEWLSHSFKIAKKLDARLDNTPDNRWGGFVLERLFTLFVEDFKVDREIDFRTFQQTYFVSSLTWVKIKLLKIKFINDLRSKYLT